MTQLGNGLHLADHHEAALSVKEAELAIERRRHGGAITSNMLTMQANLANLYKLLGRYAECLQTNRQVLALCLSGYGREHMDTLSAVINLVSILNDWAGAGPGRFDEAKSLLSQSMPVARRVLGESHRLTIFMRSSFENARYLDPSTTLNDHREAVVALEEVVRDVRRVLGATHPDVQQIERSLQNARRMLRARENPDA